MGFGVTVLHGPGLPCSPNPCVFFGQKAATKHPGRTEAAHTWWLSFSLFEVAELHDFRGPIIGSYNILPYLTISRHTLP